MKKKNKFLQINTPQEKEKQNQEKFKKVFSYTWDNENMQLNVIDVDLPVDTSQHPDIFVSVYNVKDGKRRAYIRIKQNSPDLNHDIPKWYALKSVIAGEEI